MRTRGAPPKTLTGQMPVRADHSPWWARVESELLSLPGLVGRSVSVDELMQMVPCYPDGRRPRARAAIRRLSRVLRLEERGPNGSLSRGARYTVVLPEEVVETIQADDEVVPDEDWLLSSIERMTGGK